MPEDLTTADAEIIPRGAIAPLAGRPAPRPAPEPLMPALVASLPPLAREIFAHLLARLVDLVSLGKMVPEPAGFRLLVLQYIRAEKSAGGIIYADQTKQEDVYQGCTGLVLRVGPGAYKTREGIVYAEKPWCVPGDIVSWQKLDNHASRHEFAPGLTLALINDDAVTATGWDPR